MTDEKKRPEDENQPSEEQEDLDFINSLLTPTEDENAQNKEGQVPPQPSEEELLKKKNAEEAQKRRDREAKEKAEAEAKAKAEEEAKAKAEAEAKEKAEAEAKAKAEEEERKKAEEERAKSESASKQDSQVVLLAKQIADFKVKHPEIDLAKLQKDADFTEYISGKILGKKNFNDLYEDYVGFVSRVGGKLPEEVMKNAFKASSGSSLKGAGNADIYSLDELNKKARHYASLSTEERAKYHRSIAYHDKKS